MNITIEQTYSASVHCELAAKYAYAAQWAEGSRIFLTDQAIEQVKKAAAHLGFTLTPIAGSSATDGTQEAHHVTASARPDPTSGRPCLVEPAAPIHYENDWK